MSDPTPAPDPIPAPAPKPTPTPVPPGWLSTLWGELRWIDLIHFTGTSSLTAAVGLLFFLVLRGGLVPIPTPTPDPVPPAPIAFVNSNIRVDPGKLARLEVTTEGEKVQWRFPPGFDAQSSGKLAAGTGPEGTYTIWAYTAIRNEPTPPAECTVIVGKDPNPPVPPGPNPPGPTPTPTPAPIRVLMIYDAGAKHTKGQLQAMNAKSVTDYLDAHAMKGKDGKTPEWRAWTKDANPLSSESPEIVAAFNAEKGNPVPRVVISNGKDHAEVVIPGDATDKWMIDLLSKYGGK